VELGIVVFQESKRLGEGKDRIKERTERKKGDWIDCEYLVWFVSNAGVCSISFFTHFW